MTSQRCRYDGGVDELCAALSPYVINPGWLQYPCKAGDHHRPDILVAHKSMLRSLSSLCTSLSFSKKTMQACFQKLLEEKNFERLQSADVKADWVDTMVKRMHWMCRHVAQAKIKKPKWVFLIFADMASDGDGGAKKKMKKAHEMHYVHVICNAVCTCSLQANTHVVCNAVCVCVCMCMAMV